jgi:hypothetical protein
MQNATIVDEELADISMYQTLQADKKSKRLSDHKAC